MRNSLRDICIVLRSIWLNLALYAALMLAAAGLMCLFGCYRDTTFAERLVNAFYMTRIESVPESGHNTLRSILVFVMPTLTILILGEGVLRVAGLYINRKRDRGEWEKLMVQSLSGHIVLCGAGELGRALLNRLREKCQGVPIVVVDMHPDILSELGLRSRRVHSICGDMTSHETLVEANVAGCSMVIITSGDDAHNLEAAFKVLDINPKAEIHIRLYRSGLSRMMNTATYPNIHFFSPYESAADALMEEIGTGVN
ncbi:MAG TPA: NAD(P)-binding protein [Armatimonadota bacterium]|nr:NAD(P)-binding protein [Armatimonadota bacterium]